jgi:Rieske Fe-S protein
MFCAQAAALTVFGSTLAVILPGCGSPTAPSDVASLPIANGTVVTGGITVPINASSPLSGVGSAALVQSSIGNFLVVRTAQESFMAFGATCTHQACTITGFANQTFVCPCHGSTFDTSGHVLRGPASAPLRQYRHSLPVTA